MLSKQVIHLLNVADFHYPEIERQNLEPKFEQLVRLVAAEFARAYHQTRLSEVTIEQHFLTHLGLKNERTNSRTC